MPIPPDILTALHAEQCEQVRHHQNQRSAIAGLVLTLTAALIGIITFDQKIEASDAIPAKFIIGLALYGLFCSIKQHERVRYYYARAESYRDELDSALKALDDRTNKAVRLVFFWGWITRIVRMWFLWAFLYLVICAFGFYILWQCPVSPLSPAQNPTPSPLSKTTPAPATPPFNPSPTTTPRP